MSEEQKRRGRGRRAERRDEHKPTAENADEQPPADDASAGDAAGPERQTPETPETPTRSGPPAPDPAAFADGDVFDSLPDLPAEVVRGLSREQAASLQNALSKRIDERAREIADRQERRSTVQASDYADASSDRIPLRSVTSALAFTGDQLRRLDEDGRRVAEHKSLQRLIDVIAVELQLGEIPESVRNEIYQLNIRLDGEARKRVTRELAKRTGRSPGEAVA